MNKIRWRGSTWSQISTPTLRWPVVWKPKPTTLIDTELKYVERKPSGGRETSSNSNLCRCAHLIAWCQFVLLWMRFEIQGNCGCCFFSSSEPVNKDAMDTRDCFWHDAVFFLQGPDPLVWLWTLAWSQRGTGRGYQNHSDRHLATGTHLTCMFLVCFYCSVHCVKGTRKLNYSQGPCWFWAMNHPWNSHSRKSLTGR